MKWFYTEGKLTVNSEEEERDFALADLLAETNHREKIIKIIQIIFIAVLIVLCTLQFAFTSFPAGGLLFHSVVYLWNYLFLCIRSFKEPTKRSKSFEQAF